MVNEILTAAGIPCAQGRFLRVPTGTHAVYFDNITVTAPDRVTPPTRAGLPKIYAHDVSIEVYEPKPDPDAESAIEAEFDARGIEWTKEDRYWLTDSQMYQVLYEFSYTNKTK